MEKAIKGHFDGERKDQWSETLRPNEEKHVSTLHNFKDPIRSLYDPSSLNVFLDQNYTEFCHKSLSLLLIGNPPPQDHRGVEKKLGHLSKRNFI